MTVIHAFNYLTMTTQILQIQGSGREIKYPNGGMPLRLHELGIETLEDV